MSQRVLVGVVLLAASFRPALAERTEFYLHVEPAGAPVEAAGERAEAALSGALASAGFRRMAPASGDALERLVARAGPGAWRTDALLLDLLVACPESTRFLALGRLEVLEVEGGFRAEVSLVVYDVEHSAFVLDERATATGRGAAAAALAETEAADAMSRRVHQALEPQGGREPAPPAADRYYVHVRTRVDDQPFTARGEGSGVELARTLSGLGLREADVEAAESLHEIATTALGPESLQSGEVFRRLDAEAGPALRYIVLGVSRIRFQRRDRVAWSYRANLVVRVYDVASGSVIFTSQAEGAGAALTPDQAALDADTLAAQKIARELQGVLRRGG